MPARKEVLEASAGDSEVRNSPGPTLQRACLGLPRAPSGHGLSTAAERRWRLRAPIPGTWRAGRRAERERLRSRWWPQGWVQQWQHASSFRISSFIEGYRTALFGARNVAEFQEVARLAGEHLADCLERREADSPRLAGLQNGQVGESDVDPFRELSQSHAAVVQQVVELDENGHQTVPSRSSRMRVPSRNTCASTNSSRMASHPVRSKLPLMWSGTSLVETAEAIATTQTWSSSRPSNAQAIVRNRAALLAVKGSPVRTESTIRSRRLYTT